jgi:diacylglycerol O-acyltransferase
VARLHSTLLDRSRPLWEFFVIDGLKSGQVALYAKVHHAGMDGQGGVAVAKALFDLEPTGRTIKATAPARAPQPNTTWAWPSWPARPCATPCSRVKLVRTAPSMARAVRDVVVPEKDEHGKRAWGLPKKLKLFGPRTLLNVAITNQRTFAGRTIPLAETKAIAKAPACRSMTW